MNLHICNLTEKHLPMVDAFSCVENPEHLKQFSRLSGEAIVKEFYSVSWFLWIIAYGKNDNTLLYPLPVYPHFICESTSSITGQFTW